MRKWLKRILAASAVFGVAAASAVFVAGRWAVEHYLRGEVAVGQGRLHLANPRFRWSLDLDADSLVYDSQPLRIEAGRVALSADLFRSLVHFSPAVKLDIDTLRLLARPAAGTAPKAKRPSDSLAFPAVELPVSLHFHAEELVFADSGGVRLRLTDVTLGNGGRRAVFADIGRASAPAAGRLFAAFKLTADWSARDTLSAQLHVERQKDGLDASVRLATRNLLTGSAQLRARMASSQPYAALFPGKDPPAVARDLKLDVKAGRSPRGIKLALDLETALEGLPDSLPLRPGPQRLQAKVEFSGAAGKWSLRSHGAKGDKVDLEGNLKVTGRDSLAEPAYLLRHLAATARGALGGMPVFVAGKSLSADLLIDEARYAPGAAALRARTGDGSALAADLERGVRGWGGKFFLDLKPGEKWVSAFADTNVAYQRLSLRGEMAQGRLRAVSDAVGLRAYGVLADSLHAEHRYGPRGYALGPAVLIRQGTAWNLAGSLRGDQPAKPLLIRFSNPKYGSAEFSMPRKTLIQASLRDLAVDKLPYRGLDSLARNRPRVSADFTWDKAARSGNASLKAAGAFKGEGLQGNAQATWDRDRLELREAEVDFSGGRLVARADVRLRGRQFFQLRGTTWQDVQQVSLEADRFDLAKALGVFKPNPPILAGMLDGHFAFGESLGFRGKYSLKGLRPRSDIAQIQDVILLGDGDTLRIRGVTVSKTQPLLNDTVSAALTGVLRDVQTVALAVQAGGALSLRCAGRMRAFRDFDGSLSLCGGAALPGQSGEVRDLDVRASASLAFQDPLGSLRVTSDTLTGRYVVSGLDTQTFSAPLTVRGGRVSVPAISMRSQHGGDLRGRAEYALTGNQTLTAQLGGGSLLLQLGGGDRIQLRGFTADVRADSARFTATASADAASAEFAHEPMHFIGDASGLQAVYRAPRGRSTLAVAEPMAYLQVSAVLDSSNLRYRVKSFQVLQNLFRRNSQPRRRAQVVRPMQVQIDLETAGAGNAVETDLLRASYVGNFSMHGVYPYALVQGRINSSDGELGTKAQAYKISRFEVKWLNSTLEEGEIDLEAQKRLARTCESGTTDSCTVINRLTGQLSEMRFSYDSDCSGAYGAGADVAALVYSVRRGCYSSAFSSGGAGLSYQEQALALLEPLASEYLSEAAGKLSGHWIAETRITGLGALASRNKAPADTSSAEPAPSIALEVVSREFWRTRLSMRSYYRPQDAETTSPWAYRAAVEWRPPLAQYISSPKWSRRIKDKVTVDASIYSDTTGTLQRAQDELRQRVGLNYNYDFWGYWWAKKRAGGRAPGFLAPRSGAAPRAPGGIADSAGISVDDAR